MEEGFIGGLISNIIYTKENLKMVEEMVGVYFGGEMDQNIVGNFCKDIRQDTVNFIGWVTSFNTKEIG
jgi:hypothetical protein